MRAKGKDFDEEQWYARRFRWPEPASEHNGSDARRAATPTSAHGRERP
jgi:hypothetical protein